MQLPGVEPYRPMLQKEQDVEPLLVVVSPFLHWMHLDKSILSSDLFHPCGHLTQPLFEALIVATATPYFPTMHFKQVDSPASCVNCPRAQLIHTIALDLDTFPFSQSKQARLLVAPSIELLLPGGHELQVVKEDAPVADEYVPRSHFLQLDDDELPVVLLHVPASQG